MVPIGIILVVYKGYIGIMETTGIMGVVCA